jgi:hypothetical protein
MDYDMSIIKLANAITRAFQSGRLSNEGAAKLRSLGALRSPARILSGIAKGTENIAAKKGAKIIAPTGMSDKLTAASGGGYIAKNEGWITNKPVIHHTHESRLRYLSPLHSFNKMKDNKYHTMALRHEGYELLEQGRGNSAQIYSPLTKTKKITISGVNKALNYINPKGDVGKMVKDIAQEKIKGAMQHGVGDVVGGHFNLAVLGRESNDINLLNNLYGIKGNKFNQMRKMTGEDKLIKRITGKNYGEEYINKGNLRKLRNAKYDFRVGDEGGYLAR